MKGGCFFSHYSHYFSHYYYSNVTRDVHWCVTVDYQQIANDNIANQIHGFAIDYGKFIAAASSEPEANERGSSLISRRLHYRGLQSLCLTKRKELWLCANGRFRMRSGMRKELWLCANGNILGCAVIWLKELWLCANRWLRMRSEPCAFLSRFSLFAYILQILTRVSKRL